MRAIAILVLVFTVTTWGVEPDPAAAMATVTFTEVSDSVGLGDEVFRSANHHGLGVIWIDYDLDGWDDLLVTNGRGSDTHLYHNDGGTFTLVDELLPALADVEKMGASFGDYDNDGDADIYIYTDNETLNLTDPINPLDGPANILLQNQWAENGGAVVVGEPLFADVAATALVDDLAAVPFGPTYPGYRATSGSWVDYDRDGLLDLYVAHWAVQHSGTDATGNKLYRNNGDGTFSDVTLPSGVDDGVSDAGRRSTLASMAAHLDDDLWPDIYEANVADPAPIHHDRLLRNDGAGGFFDATGDTPGLGDDTGAAMGIAVGDVNLDGHWDVYLTDIVDNGIDATAGNTLYLGNGDGTFADVTTELAGTLGSSAWGANFLDADHDGDEDLFVATMGENSEYEFFLNDGNGSFTDVSVEVGVTGLARDARGSAVADYDNDGDLDIAVVNTQRDAGSDLLLFRNDTSDPGHYLKIRLESTQSNLSAIGAVVRVIPAPGSPPSIRQVTGGNSAHSQDSSVVHIGVGDHTTLGRVYVDWPSGHSQLLEDVAVDQTLVVREPGHPDDPNVLGWYSFDAGDATDDSGQGRDGIVTGSPPSIVGHLGLGMRLADTAQAIEVPSDPALETGTVVAQLWVIVKRSPTGGQAVLSKGVPGGPGYRLWMRNGNIEFSVFESSLARTTVVSPSPVAINTWVSVGAVYDGTDLELWIDGELAATTPASRTIVNSEPLFIGSTSTGVLRFRGGFDELRIFESVLTPEEHCVYADRSWDSATSTCS